MADFNDEFLNNHRQFRIKNKKLTVLFPLFAVIIAILVFWCLKLVGITVTGEALCELEEHTHSKSCYVTELICDYKESEKTTVAATTTTAAATTAATETSDKASESDETEKASETTAVQKTTVTETTTAPSHKHTDECCRDKLICTLPEHTHSTECFPDKSADKETVSVWLKTIENVTLTNDTAENLVAIALSQKGYKESSVNYEFDESGIKRGYTRYGEWYGTPYGKWNTLFTSFCINYANINNSDPLETAGAESMRLAWQKRGVYSPAAEHKAEKGDIVFFDTDSDSKADRTGIVITASESTLIVIEGNVDGAVDTVSHKISSAVLGYGLTDELHFAKDTEYKSEETEKEEEETTIIIAESPTVENVPILMRADAPSQTDDDGHTVEYRTDLTDFVVDVNIKTQDNVEISNNSTVYIGQTYVITMEFKEDNEGEEWLQFGHNGEHYLTYQIPGNFQCEPFTEWHHITAKTENGMIEDVGKYFIDENGYLLVTFYDDENGVCFGHRYSNVDFIIEFNAIVGSTQSGTTTEVKFNENVNIDLKVDGGAGVEVTKTHGDYDSDNYTVDYIVTVEATHGLVKDFTLEDYTWYNHYVLRDTVVVTDLNGIPLDPQPTVGEQFTQADNIAGGFSVVGLPDFSAGEGYIITYKSKISDEYINNDKVSLGNGVYGAGKDSNGTTVGSYKEHWVEVEPEKMTKNGRQTVVEVNGESIPVIEWQVVIKKNHNNLHGTVIIDTLGEGLQYMTGKPIIIRHYDENGGNPTDQTLSWDNVQINGNSMSFPLPDGYMFTIIYYTTFEEPDDDEVKNFTNSVSATINGKYETAGGTADVVSFIPRIQKTATGNDGEYVYYTIEADVPSIIKNWGSFYITDEASLWNETTKGFFYADNVPEELIITAVTESGNVVTFTPYIAGGPTENTYIIEAPLEGDRHHSFRIFFNTSSANEASSKWILNENSVLRITYKLPFDAKTGYEWSGELTGDKTVGDLLSEEYILANRAQINYTDIITDESSAPYTYSTKISKNSRIHDDGTIDYTVIFHNTVPGSNGNSGILSSVQNIIFTDTFDEKMEYVQGSLTVTCYDPWNASRWLNKYTYEGAINSNTMNIPASELKFDSTNPDSGWGLDWLSTLSNYQVYCNSMGGGNHIFTYTLKLKDEYLYSTEENKYTLDNTAEIKWGNDGTSGPATETTEYKTGLMDKQVVQENNKLNFDIHINRNALDILPGSDTLVIEDTMTENLSVYWDSIGLLYEDENGNWIDFTSSDSDYTYSVTYDPTTNKLTFTVPDSLHIRIDYTTLITQSGLVSVSNTVRIDAKAQVTDIIDAVFKVEQHSGGASGSMETVTLIKQDGITKVPLPGVTFLMYGPVGDEDAVLPPGADATIVTDRNKTLRYIGSYTTGEDGTVKIASQYLTNGGPYALVEVAPPEGYIALEKPVYFYFYNADPTGIIQTVTTLIAVENYTFGFVLPETGGTGIFPLAIIGFSLMAFPILYSTIRRKRERRST